MGELIPKAEPAEPTTDITFLFFDKKTFLRRCFLAIVFNPYDTDLSCFLDHSYWLCFLRVSSKSANPIKLGLSYLSVALSWIVQLTLRPALDILFFH